MINEKYNSFILNDFAPLKTSHVAFCFCFVLIFTFLTKKMSLISQNSCQYLFLKMCILNGFKEFQLPKLIKKDLKYYAYFSRVLLFLFSFDQNLLKKKYNDVCSITFCMQAVSCILRRYLQNTNDNLLCSSPASRSYRVRKLNSHPLK